ncbi:MAG: DNA repair protein RadA [Desulfovibrio sp.]|nr:DNA repair protein RadA [Desulfovibrio sp.]
MAKLREQYRCAACGSRLAQWQGRCPECGAWNTLEPVQVRAGSGRADGTRPQPEAVLRLSEAPDAAGTVFSTGTEALDRILGQGFVPGSCMLLGGEPGIGKSTLLLQAAGAVAASGRRAVYLSGEESLSRLRARAERLALLHEHLYAVSTTRLEDLYPLLDGDPPALLIIDSVQTLSTASAEGLPGNVSQVRAVAADLAERCRRCNTAVVLVGHVTKDGSLAGPRLLEHMVDTVISLEGDRGREFRILRVLKNRFGPNMEMLVFRMLDKGLEPVEDPSTVFLGARDASLSGAAVVMAMDGRRPLAAEVQALVTRSWLPAPRRAGLGFDVNRLHLLLAVLEKHLRLSFAQSDIYAKLGGGMKLMEPGMDAALVAAVLSSYYDVPLPEKAVFWGEVDLNGRLRPVEGQDLRERQARRLGYTPLVRPPVGPGEQDGGFGSIAQIRQAFFARKAGPPSPSKNRS